MGEDLKHYTWDKGQWVSGSKGGVVPLFLTMEKVAWNWCITIVQIALNYIIFERGSSSSQGLGRWRSLSKI
jgi:hypothetical protein